MMHRLVSCGAIALLLSSFVACTDRDQVRDVPETEEALESVPPAGDAPEPADDPGAELPLDLVEAEVILRDDDLEMAGRLPAAFTRFRIRNEGSQEHGFEIRGPDVEKGLPSPVPPGGEATLEADLKAGVYQVFCPLEDHAEGGIRRELTVGELPPATPR